MAIRPRRDEEAIGNLASFIVLLVAIGILLGVYSAYVVPVRPEAALVALPGDTVLAQYVGTFEDTGAVFDTSSLTVARDNASYAKAFSFSWRARWEGPRARRPGEARGPAARGDGPRPDHDEPHGVRREVLRRTDVRRGGHGPHLGVARNRHGRGRHRHGDEQPRGRVPDPPVRRLGCDRPEHRRRGERGRGGHRRSAPPRARPRRPRGRRGGRRGGPRRP